MPYREEDERHAEDQRQHVAEGSKSEHNCRGRRRKIPHGSPIPPKNIYNTPPKTEKKGGGGGMGKGGWGGLNFSRRHGMPRRLWHHDARLPQSLHRALQMIGRASSAPRRRDARVSNQCAVCAAAAAAAAAFSQRSGCAKSRTNRRVRRRTRMLHPPRSCGEPPPRARSLAKCASAEVWTGGLKWAARVARARAHRHTVMNSARTLCDREGCKQGKNV